MTPVLPTSNICYFASVGNASITRKDCSPRNCSILRKQTMPQRYSTLLSISPLLFSPFRTECVLPAKLRTRKVAAAGTDVAVEEADSAVKQKESDDLVGSIPVPTEPSEDSSIKSDAVPTSSQSKLPRAARKSDVPPIKNEDLVPGTTFTGKVRSILPFGAFVDFGAFTDGLVHVSQLSDSFVKDVKDIVSIGQEVTVRLVEANTETGRISLTMRNGDEANKGEQQKRVNSGSDKSRSPRTSSSQSNQKRAETRKSSKFVKGQELEGTVKNMTRSGAFISLPEGEEGFLPTSEEAEGFENIMGGTSLQTGQEVKVRVLRINRGQVTLTMKDEDDAAGSDTIIRPAVVHTATNPFVLAFRNNKDISAFLDKQQKEKEPSLEVVEDTQVENNAIDKVGSPEIIDNHEGQEGILPDASQGVEVVVDAQVDAIDKVEGQEGILPDASQGVEVAVDVQVDAIDNVGSSEIIGNHEGQEGILPDASQGVEVVVDAQVDASDKVGSPEIIGNHEGQEGVLPDASKGVEVVADAQVDAIDKVEGQEGILPDASQGVEVVVDAQADAIDKVGSPEIIANHEGQEASSISPALVKQLREETGAGMMDCKKALLETGGDLIKAQEYLRKKGLASADKKASRTTAEGRVGAYIHDSRIGVLIEVNCETDFVARGDIFKELVDDLAMQVAACAQVQYIDTDEIPKEIVNKEREIEMQKEDLLSKPEQIRSKIVDGRIQKRLDELALLEQPFIKNDKTVVKDLVKQTIATIGENIKVKRFARYILGEGLEKKTQDFAAEVAAQTTAKAPALGKDQSSTGDAKETVEKSNKATVSAVLVKQLREETGAGMMDCKKALSETGGDLEKAQEYLRKKGLSAADKKSSRLAAEGRIGSYIHDSRIGVLIEVNCETDFVGRSEKFKELVDDLAMQIVACPQVQYVTLEDIPAEIVNREKELEMQREDLQSKPENIREKIVEGRVSKRLGELVLLEQAFIKDDSVLVKDIVKQSVAAIGENIKVRRFVRFTLGEDKTETNKGGE